MKYGIVIIALWFAVAAAESDVGDLESKVSTMLGLIDSLKSELWKTFEEKVAYKTQQAKSTNSEAAITCTAEATQAARNKLNAYVKSFPGSTENDPETAIKVIENFEHVVTDLNMNFTKAGLDMAIAVRKCLKL